jgi:translocation and assembly module TamB
LKRALLIGGTAVLGGATLLAIGPGAPWVVTQLAQDREVWRLGALEISDVSGAHLGDLKAGRIALKDAHGVWLEGRDIDLVWRPFSIVTGPITIDHINADTLSVLRKPVLSPEKAGAPAPDITLQKLTVSSLNLADGVAGAAAAFRLDAALSTHANSLNTLALKLARTDAGGDELVAEFAQAPLRLQGHLQAPEGGAFASFLGAPVSARAQDAKGLIRIVAESRGAPIAQATLTPTNEPFAAQAMIRLDALPVMASLHKRFGDHATLSATRDKGGAFTFVVATPNLRALAFGQSNQRFQPQGPIRTALTADAPAIVMDRGELQLNGTLREDGATWRFEGRSTLANAQRFGLTMSASGPLNLRVSRAAIDGEATFEALSITADAPNLGRITKGATGATRFSFQTGAQTLKVLRARIIGPNLDLDGQGELAFTTTDPTGVFGGGWRLKSLGPALQGLAPASWDGKANGQWRMARAENEAWALTAQGEAQDLQGMAAPLSDLVGRSAKLSAALRFTAAGAQAESLTVETPRLRVGSRGALAGKSFDLILEASARGPIVFGAGELTGAFTATGRLGGPYATPRLSATSKLGELDVGGVTLSNSEAQLDLVLVNSAASGTAGLVGTWNAMPARAQSPISIKGEDVTLGELRLSVAQVEGIGQANLTPQGPKLDLALSGRLDGLSPGLTGALSGALKLDGDVVSIDARANNGALAPGLQFTTAALRVSGKNANSAVVYTADGEAFSVAGQGTLTSDAAGARLSTKLSGQIGAARFATDGPLQVTTARNQMGIAGALKLNGDEGDLRFDYATRGAALRFALDARNAPLSALPWNGDSLAGAITGSAKFEGEGARLSGAADFSVKGLRLARRSVDAVDGEVSMRLNGAELVLESKARSQSGLSASLTGALPVEASAAPLRLARRANAPGRFDWKADGRIDELWALFGPLDQAVGGNISGQGRLLLADGGLSGDGALRLSGGAFDDKTTGVSLRDVSADIAFSEAGATLKSLAAKDRHDGRLTGSGFYGREGAGKIDLQLKRMRIVNRPDAKASGDGALSLIWTPASASLSGAITLTDTEAREPEIAAAEPVTIDVVEINAPVTPSGTKPHGPAIRPRAMPVKLDVALTAPGRLFTRGRGLDAEWALDARVRGSPSAPLLSGEARLLRGRFTLAGRPFNLDSGEIRFDGPVENAEIRLVAISDAPDLAVRMQVSGSAAKPEVALSSTPALPEDEILPRLLFNRSAGELSGFEAAQLAASLAALAGQSSFDVAATARAAVDLDRLDVRQEAGEIFVTGGKYITRDVYLEVSRGALGATATNVEWQVQPRLFLISSFLPNGDQRVALRWRRDY